MAGQTRRGLFQDSKLLCWGSLMFQAFFVSSLHLDNNGIMGHFSRIMADLDSFASGELAGGGMIGALHAPISFLSNIGSIFIGLLCWIGDFLMSPYHL